MTLSRGSSAKQSGSRTPSWFLLVRRLLTPPRPCSSRSTNLTLSVFFFSHPPLRRPRTHPLPSLTSHTHPLSSSVLLRIFLSSPRSAFVLVASRLSSLRFRRKIHCFCSRFLVRFALLRSFFVGLCLSPLSRSTQTYMLVFLLPSRSRSFVPPNRVLQPSSPPFCTLQQPRPLAESQRERCHAIVAYM